MNEINPEFIKGMNRIRQGGDNQIKRPGKGTGPEFNQILEQQVKKTDSPGSASATTGLGEIQGTFRAQHLQYDFDASEFTRKLDASLKKLDMYAAWLSDPEKTMKDAQNLIDTLSLQTDELQRQLDAHNDADPKLADIFNLLQTTVKTEQIKLNRGDYL